MKLYQQKQKLPRFIGIPLRGYLTYTINGVNYTGTEGDVFVVTEDGYYLNIYSHEEFEKLFEEVK